MTDFKILASSSILTLAKLILNNALFGVPDDVGFGDKFAQQFK